MSSSNTRSDSSKNNNSNRNRKSVATARSITASLLNVKNQISNEVPQNRRQEIYEYMKLFGYKPDSTVIQVHITGFFRKKTYSQREVEQHKAAVKRYGGTTFVIIGRTHDPSIMDLVIKPKKKNAYDRSPGYVGYLWKNKDPHKRAPHEVLPIDFTPVHLPYPTDWKNIFATKGFMIALHVPSSFAKSKNKLTRHLYRIGKTRIDVKKEWTFLDELENINYMQEGQLVEGPKDAQNQMVYASNVSNTRTGPRRKIIGGDKSTSKSKVTNVNGEDVDKVADPLQILKLRLAKGEITKNEYKELYNAITS